MGGGLYPYIMAYMILLGCGLGIFASPNMSSIMGSVPPDRRGIASGLRATFFNVGLTVSLNLAILVMTFTISYGQITQVLIAPPGTVLRAEKDTFALALRQAYLWMGIVNTIAIVPSFLRGKRVRTNDGSPAGPVLPSE